MKFYGRVRCGKRSKGLDFGSNLDHHADCPSSAITQQIMIKFSGKLHNGTRNNLLYFGCGLDHHVDSPKWEHGQYGGNELPWPRRFAPSECSCCNSIKLFALKDMSYVINMSLYCTLVHVLLTQQKDLVLDQGRDQAF